ncbi:MAG: DinB family protein [Gemmata sp.]
MRHPTLTDTRAAKATMPPNWLLAAGCRMGRLLIRRKADDLTDDEFVFQPVPGANSAAWVVGHLAVTARREGGTARALRVTRARQPAGGVVPLTSPIPPLLTRTQQPLPRESRRAARPCRRPAPCRGTSSWANSVAAAEPIM